MNNMTNKPTPAQFGPESLDSWLRRVKIQTHFAAGEDLPWSAWKSPLSAREHYDVAGYDGFAYSETRNGAIQAIIDRFGVVVPKQFENELQD